MNLDELSDAELVQRFKSGDSLAFDAIVRRFQDRVFRLASVWLHDSQHAGDVSQEVFLRAFKGLRGFRFRAAPFTWLYRVTRNVCNEFNRRRVPEALEQEPIDYENLPDAQVFHRETARQVRELVDVLPERQREVVLLRIFEELSVKETARAMGCREGTVKALLHKANQNLRGKLDNSGMA
ncbi:MAG: sigma-70 family RNA polymerase sigma factor [Gammaproteobacteria bacterium]|nr:sigma-70 family RNA polymerase sigma factor [Gammaproteobacteria bacterium]